MKKEKKLVHPEKKTFREDTNRCYRHLETKAIEVTAHPSKKKAKHYWQSIWEVEACHNEKAEWIRREEKEEEGTTNKGWTPVRKPESTSVLAKMRN
jgi:hypothetical protein